MCQAPESMACRYVNAVLHGCHACMPRPSASLALQLHCMMQEEERRRILRLVEALEAGNPLQAPTEHLDRVDGTWRLLFSTITILVRYCYGTGGVIALVENNIKENL